MDRRRVAILVWTTALVAACSSPIVTPGPTVPSPVPSRANPTPSATPRPSGDEYKLYVLDVANEAVIGNVPAAGIWSILQLADLSRSAVVLTGDDVESYDWTTQTLVATRAAQTRFQAMLDKTGLHPEETVPGWLFLRYFVVTLDGVRLYGGVFDGDNGQLSLQYPVIQTHTIGGDLRFQFRPESNAGPDYAISEIQNIFYPQVRDYFASLGRLRYSSPIPPQKSGGSPAAGTGATAIAAGVSHTCAIVARGKVRCWGASYFGELGSATRADGPLSVLVPGISGATAIATGWYHSCAIVGEQPIGNTDYSTHPDLECWGANFHGELGPGVDHSNPSPVTMITSTESAMSGSRFRTCGITYLGVRCWGSNYSDELGANPVGDYGFAVGVPGTAEATAVAAGFDHTCAIVAGGGVFCWGADEFDELGDGGHTDSARPVAVTGISDAVAISAGGLHTCALLASGQVSCWGYGYQGQLGDGSSVHRWSPTGGGSMRVAGLSGVKSISAGFDYTCALLSDGSVFCWGADAYDQLGDGARTDRSTPVRVAGVSGATAITAGFSHACAIVASGDVRCWGDQ